MRAALKLAIDAVVAQAPAGARDKLAWMLGEQFAQPPRLPIDLTRPLTVAFRDAIAAQLEPLTIYRSNDTGTPFYDDVGITPEWLVSKVAEAVVYSVRWMASQDDLTALAARLDADDMRAAIIELREMADQQTSLLERAVEVRTAEEAAGHLGRLLTRLDDLPAAARPELEAALSDNPDAIEEVIVAMTDPAAPPEETINSWVNEPPRWLGTPNVPERPVVWRVIAEIAASYGLGDAASSAFQMAAKAGGVGRPYLLARAAWAVLQMGDLGTAQEILESMPSAAATEPALSVLAGMIKLSTHTSSLEPNTADQQVVAEPQGNADSQALRSSLIDQLVAWDPVRPADRDMRARIWAQLELYDTRRSRAQSLSAALTVLDDALTYGWLDDTAVAVATFLRMRAASGYSEDRSADLLRAERLALTVRDARRRVRRKSAPAVRLAISAAAAAGRYRRVVSIGSAQHGEATPEEAADLEVTEQVILAAAQGVPEVAETLEANVDQIPDTFLRAWARALLAMRSGNDQEHSATVLIALWQDALTVATTDSQCREALQGLAAAGAEDLPGLDELLADDAATAAEWRARNALARDDPDTAIDYAFPYRDSSAPVASVLASAYGARGNTEAAVDTLTTAASRFDHDDLIIQAAQICIKADEPDRAADLLTEVLRTASVRWAGRGSARALLGELQARSGAWIDAIASWESALEEDPYQEPVRWYLAQALSLRGSYSRAWEVLTTDPRSPGVLHIPSTPQTPAAGQLVLFLMRREMDLNTLVSYGLDYINQFADDEQFTGRALTLITAASAAVEVQLDPALQDRLQVVVTRFTTQYPDSQLFIQLRGTTEELIAYLNEAGRPSAELASESARHLLEVNRGNEPLGILTLFTRRPYGQGIVTFIAGVITANGDTIEHSVSTADAGLAIAVESFWAQGRAKVSTPSAARPRLMRSPLIPISTVVVDATSLYIRTLLPSLDAVLVAGFRDILITDTAYTDIVAARDDLLVSSPGSWVVDPASGQGYFAPIDPDVQALRRTTIDKIYTLASSCSRAPSPSSDQPSMDELRGPNLDPWLSGVRLAASRGVALWADDIALRRLARSEGISAFSTLGLVDAYAHIGRISPPQREDAVRALIQGYVGDFTPDEFRLRTLAGIDSDSRGAVCSAMAKPAFWLSLAAATRTYHGLLQDFNSSASSIIPDLVRVSLQGVMRTGWPPEQIRHLCARLTATAINTLGPLGNVPRVLLAMRDAIGVIEPSTPDLLPAIVRQLLATYERLYTSRGRPDTVLAADHVRSLFSRCSPEDQTTVRRTILLPPSGTIMP